MRTAILSILTVLVLIPAGARATGPFAVDPGHSAVIFKALHFGAGYTYGRFRKLSGSIEMDEKKPQNSKVSIEIDAGSVYTGDKKRDAHLKGPDFLNTKQYPKIVFKSARVKKTRGGATVTGQLSLHGVTRGVTVKMRIVGKGKDPWGNSRVGFEGTFSVKLKDYKIKGMAGAVGDRIDLIVAVEGMRK